MKRNLTLTLAGRCALGGLALALAQISAQSVAQTLAKPDALLAIDLNRVAVVERIVEQWRSDLAGMPVESFRGKLMALRADQLMSANLSGSFDAVLEQLNASQSGTLASASALEAARAGVVDADTLERFAQRVSLSEEHAKAIGEIDRDLVYTPIAPCNLMDTRPGVSPTPPEGAPALAPGYAVRTVQVTGRCAIPAGAKGIAALYTIENNPSTGGVVFAGDAGGSGGAVVSWSAPSQYSSGSGITPLSTTGAMQLQSAGSTHIKVDITGYFMPPSRNGAGLRVTLTSDLNAPNATTTVNGSSANTATGVGDTIAGGGSTATNCFNPVTVAQDRNCRNEAGNYFATVSGGGANISTGNASTVAGGSSNDATNDGSTVGGGYMNRATGVRSTIPGGQQNVASGQDSFAAGLRAKATHNGSFVWADGQNIDFASAAANEFSIRANGGVRLNNDTNLSFGTQVRQMINLWSAQYGIGTQASSTYFRSGSNFAWYQGGSHTDADFAAGTGGTTLMALRPTAVATTASGVAYAQSFVNNSDVTVKTAFAKVNPVDVLKKVVAMPITSWAYKSDAKARHIGPMAQDFAKAFGLGAGDKNIATVDADGVALAAIQGLNQKLVADAKSKDSKIDKLERELAAIKKKLGL